MERAFSFKRFGLAVLVCLVIIASSSLSLGGEAMVTGHWKRPGATSPSFSAKDLHPKECGACHEEKLRDWSASLHSKSIGPGLLFQLDPLSDPATAVACYFCHAPLSIQNETIQTKTSSGNVGYAENADFDAALKATGVSCAACHARGAGIVGPPSPRLEGLKKGKGRKHSTQVEAFFTEARFCAACHQLKEGFRLKGRLLVNTYAEWKESPAGRAGISCQAWHMPGRRHLFRGIHDVEMARSGISIETEKIKTKSGPLFRLTITNTSTGHYYPTYATPLIKVRAFLVDNEGRALKGTEKTAFIGRQIALDLSQEYFDTRIAPLRNFVLDYPIKKTGGAKQAVFEAIVYPDEFYTRFYEYFLGQDMSAKKKEEVREAHRRSLKSAYELFRKELPLKDLALNRNTGR